MAIVVLGLWLLTAGAGFYLLVTSSLGRARAAGSAGAPDPQPTSAPAAPTSVSAAPTSVSAAPTSVSAAPTSVSAAPGETRRPVRDRFETPSLAAARQAPVLPEARSLMEFAHPACALIGLACWLGFTLIHNRTLGWIAFALVAVTACVGLAWFTANARAARHGDGDGPAPSFAGRLVVLHGCAAAVTITLAALTALVTRG
jgi:hypothetical protein